MSTVINEARQVAGLDLWRVAVVDDVNQLRASRREELLDWLRAHGVPVDRCSPRLVVTQSAVDRKIRAHVTVQAHDDEGRIYIDHAAKRVHTEPLVIVVESYPAWLIIRHH